MIDAIALATSTIVRDIAPDSVEFYNQQLSLACQEFLDDSRVSAAGAIALTPELIYDSLSEATIPVMWPNGVSKLLEDTGLTLPRLDQHLDYDSANTAANARFTDVNFYHFRADRGTTVNNVIRDQLTSQDIGAELWSKVQKVVFTAEFDQKQSITLPNKNGGTARYSLDPKPLDALWFLPETTEEKFWKVGRRALGHLASNGIGLQLSKAHLYIAPIKSHH